jgi:Ca-activated chloride channel family protein
MKRIILYILFSLTITSSYFSQENETGTIRMLFIFDGSNSMNAQWEKSSKIKIAKALMTQTLDSLKYLDNVEVALRMYGHQTRIVPGQQDCSDTKLEVPFASGPDNYDKIKNKIRGLVPKGTTPIARSLEYAATDFPECDDCRNVIVLITDGIEACDEDPCAVALALRSKGIILKPFIIGVGLDTSYIDQFNCVGEFLSAETEDSFKSVLSFVISQALSNTTTQVKLYDAKNKAKETNVTMSFYDQKKRKLLYTYMHTMNKESVPDTLSLDPLYTYKMVVHTIPEVVVEDVKLTPGKHNIIEANTPQGELHMRVQGTNSVYTGINAIIRIKNEHNTINVQNMNTIQNYLVGSYDLEVLTLPRLYFNDVKINQSRKTEITIPQYGTAIISKGPGSAAIFQIKEGENKWVCDLNKDVSVNNINLLPGNYKITYRFIRSTSTAHTIVKTFKITSGYEENISL